LVFPVPARSRRGHFFVSKEENLRSRIQEEFDGYVKAAFPPDISAEQMTDLRRTFFAGACSLHGLIMSELSPGLEATQDDLAMMLAISAELLAFDQMVRRGER
jgi:hypothetical protein